MTHSWPAMTGICENISRDTSFVVSPKRAPCDHLLNPTNSDRTFGVGSAKGGKDWRSRGFRVSEPYLLSEAPKVAGSMAAPPEFV